MPHLILLPGLEVDGRTSKLTGEPSQESAVSPYSNPPHIQLSRLDKEIDMYSAVLAGIHKSNPVNEMSQQIYTRQNTFNVNDFLSHVETPLFRCTSDPSILLPTSARCDRYPDCPTGEVNQTVRYHNIPTQSVPLGRRTIPYQTLPYHTIPNTTIPYNSGEVNQYSHLQFSLG